MKNNRGYVDFGTFFGITAILLIIGLFAYIMYFLFTEPSEYEKISNNGTKQVQVVDGCEYLINRTAYDYYVLSHKGNCTNHSVIGE